MSQQLPFSKEAQLERSPGQPRYCDETGVRVTRRECDGPICRGRRNRAKGRRGQKKARDMLGLQPERWAGRHANEETWTAAVRVEVKAGAQVKPVATRYVAARNQSDAARPIGDLRPFVFVAAPDGTQPLVVIRQDELRDVVYALVQEWSR